MFQNAKIIIDTYLNRMVDYDMHDACYNKIFLLKLLMNTERKMKN